MPRPRPRLRTAIAVAAGIAALAAAAGRPWAGSAAIVNVTLDSLVVQSDVVLVGRILSFDAHRYPAELAPPDAGGGLAYLTVEVEETLKPAAGGPVPGSRIAVFDPGLKFAYEKAALIKHGVVSYADPRYRTTVRESAVKPGARLIFFLKKGAPPHFPPRSFLLSSGSAVESVQAKPRVANLVRLVAAAEHSGTSDWKRCPDGGEFGCRPRSQGVAPARGERLPEFCGCIPRCPRERMVLLTFEGRGRWPDGSAKARFTCSAQGIPSAAPAHGGSSP